MFAVQKPLIISFGSQATGRATSSSDFDVAVLGARPLTLEEKTTLTSHISDTHHINEDRIDLIDLRAASPLLAQEVARNGILLEGDPFDFTKFKVRAWKMYEDTAKFRRLREQSLKTYVERTYTQKA